ncbi:Mov34/MPN/PAD-1 family protein [Rhabdaerophilum sp. SD176]|uniref:Mov34/MPN/PAD-1 family protein n=1 Tax=Rhabdaerophilum sp. SD176 TaxID=2983548 RepID=UPI0024DFF0E9|nr:Mov34/MPN/PAD-1 family protein [Rhabdaerophilum sp. SD176]
MALHTWWTTFGTEVADTAGLIPVLARELASLAMAGALPGMTLIGLRQSTELGYAAVGLEVAVERPQDLAHPIRAIEQVAVVLPYAGGQPSIVSLREDFPDTLHQNWSPPGGPYALCIDDRPWAEARLTTSANDIARRIQLWLAKAARGELHDPAQPPDPLFFTSQLGLVLPQAALADTKEPGEVAGIVRPDNQNLIISRPADPSDRQPPAFTVLAFQAQPQTMARLRHAPDTLAALADELGKCGIRLMDELKNRLKAWAGLEHADVRRLASRLAVVVVFPVAEGQCRAVNDFRAFLTFDTAGEIGVALGVLCANNSKVGDKRAYMTAIPEGAPGNQPLRIEPAQVHFSLNRDLAAAIAGHATPDRRRAVLVGAGSLGSQLSVALAREGAFAWTISDDDFLLPHNLVRHALFVGDLGAPKAAALADTLAGLLDEPVDAIQCNVLTPAADCQTRLNTALTEAEVIIDASASVAVSRHLSDLPNAKARRVCAFFNPSGTSVVLLTENADRSLTLRDLEAQYHRLVLTDAALAGHLAASGPGVRYTGSCRALTNRIPASSAAILSALVAKGIVSALAEDEATITLWTLHPNGEVSRVQRRGAPVVHLDLGAWTIAYDAGLLDDLAAMRRAMLPNETGGVLLGIADMSRKSVHIAHALPAPEDSRASQTGFERGVVNLTEQVAAAVAATMHQLRYVGEWHSHPDCTSSMPSSVDLMQLRWLGHELENEGLPGLMAIAAQDDRFSFALSRPAKANTGDAQ